MLETDPLSVVDRALAHLTIFHSSLSFYVALLSFSQPL